MMNFGTQSSAPSTNSKRFGNKPEATAFFNQYLPAANGGEVQLGGLPLYDTLSAHKPLLDECMKSPQHAERLIKEWLLKNLRIEFKPNVRREVAYSFQAATTGEQEAE